jgi:hypothetical protein
MTQSPIPLPSGVTVDDLAPEVRGFVQFLATAQILTPAQRTLLSHYEALSPERRRLVDDLLCELNKLL